MISAQSPIRSVIRLFCPALVSLFLVTSQTAMAQASGYAFERAIVINHSQVANSDQSNFPVLISATLSDLATVANGGNVQSALGYDIIFTSDAAGQNALAFEQETYSPSTGAINLLGASANCFAYGRHFHLHVLWKRRGNDRPIK